MTLQSSCKAQNLSATFFQGTIPARAGALVTQTKVTERFGLLQSTVHMILKKVKRKQICHAPRKAACRPGKLNKRQEGLLIRYVTSLHKEDCNYFTVTRLIKKKDKFKYTTSLLWNHSTFPSFKWLAWRVCVTCSDYHPMYNELLRFIVFLS